MSPDTLHKLVVLQYASAGACPGRAWGLLPLRQGKAAPCCRTLMQACTPFAPVHAAGTRNGEVVAGHLRFQQVLGTISCCCSTQVRWNTRTATTMYLLALALNERIQISTCRSRIGFQSCSRKMTVSAEVRLRPKPPTCVVRRSAWMVGSELNCCTMSNRFPGSLLQVISAGSGTHVPNLWGSRAQHGHYSPYHTD